MYNVEQGPATIIADVLTYTSIHPRRSAVPIVKIVFSGVERLGNLLK